LVLETSNEDCVTIFFTEGWLLRLWLTSQACTKSVGPDGDSWCRTRASSSVQSVVKPHSWRTLFYNYRLLFFMSYNQSCVSCISLFWFPVVT